MFVQRRRLTIRFPFSSVMTTNILILTAIDLKLNSCQNTPTTVATILYSLSCQTLEKVNPLANSGRMPYAFVVSYREHFFTSLPRTALIRAANLRNRSKYVI